jgi:hypothetical protein
VSRRVDQACCGSCRSEHTRNVAHTHAGVVMRCDALHCTHRGTTQPKSTHCTRLACSHGRGGYWTVGGHVGADSRLYWTGVTDGTWWCRCTHRQQQRDAHPLVHRHCKRHVSRTQPRRLNVPACTTETNVKCCNVPACTTETNVKCCNVPACTTETNVKCCKRAWVRILVHRRLASVMWTQNTTVYAALSS